MEHSPALDTGSDAFARRFSVRAGGSAAVLTFADFMDLALYDPEVGYYRAPRARVGRTTGTDFYTSTTMAGVFGPLVAVAAETILGNERESECEFVEIGAEPGRCVLDGVNHGFRAVRTVRVGEPFELRGSVVVFSNELFDSQPFHRVKFREGRWRELGVALAPENLAWVELPELSPAVAAIANHLPGEAVEGYVVDLPLAAQQLACSIAAQPWAGLFLAFDYGRTWSELCTEYPAGTGRAYVAHHMSGDLLAQPGQQDLTCHVCWDWLEAELRAARFANVTRESQEAFFVRRATAAIEKIVASDANDLAPLRAQLRHLLHPALLGQRFEALWAARLT